jgi:two-component system response regulator PilR (NtrC family)
MALSGESSSKWRPSILVVEDDEGMREFLSILLEKEGYLVETVEDGMGAIRKVGERSFDLVITDLMMPKMDGIEVLQQIKERDPDIGVILITAYASTETAVDAMRGGAFDYISKPFDVEEIKEVVKEAIRKRPKADGISPAQPQTRGGRFGDLLGVSPQMQKIFDLIPKVASTPANVLITGESGTGKELVAKAIHTNSPRKDAPMVTINCGGLPESLLESELFGFERGAFTGAVRSKPGLMEVANGGTVFLDEVGELPMALQVKLLRVTQDKRFQRVGGTEEISVDVRLICATNKNLEDEVIRGRFREDLFYRLNVIHIHIPPLRERREDIPVLAEHFLKKYSREMNKEIQSFSTYSMEALKSYDFPGNVRELENIIQRGVALEQSKIILPESLTLAHHKRRETQWKGKWETPDLPEEGISLDDVLEEIERELIQKALTRTKGVKTEAARLLGISFRSLRYKMEKLGMN